VQGCLPLNLMVLDSYIGVHMLSCTCTVCFLYFLSPFSQLLKSLKKIFQLNIFIFALETNINGRRPHFLLKN